MGTFDYHGTKEFDAVTAAMRRFVEQELTPRYKACIPDGYQYAIYLQKPGTSASDYYLQVEAGEDPERKRLFAANMVKTLNMPGYDRHLTGIGPYDTRFYLGKMVENYASHWKTFQPIYDYLAECKIDPMDNWSANLLPEEYWIDLDEHDFTVRSGGIRVECLICTIKHGAEYDANCVDTFDVSRNVTVAFDGAYNTKFNWYFTMQILKRFFEVLKECQPDVLYVPDIAGAVRSHNNMAAEFWYTNVFEPPLSRTM